MKTCECGCGNIAPLATRTNASRGHIKGLACRFIRTHSPLTGKVGSLAASWKDGRGMANGYVVVLSHGHPRATTRNLYINEHILIAEKAFGQFLPQRAVVHHWNKDRKSTRLNSSHRL